MELQVFVQDHILFTANVYEGQFYFAQLVFCKLKKTQLLQLAIICIVSF